MTTKNIQDIVTEFFEKQNDIWKSEAGYSIADCKIKERELLTQLVKEVEEGERENMANYLHTVANNIADPESFFQVSVQITPHPYQ